MLISRPIIILVLTPIFLCYLSCNRPSKTIDPDLLRISNQMIDYPENSLSILETEYSKSNLDESNLAYFYLLLTENKHILNQSLLNCDSLLDWSIDHLHDNTLKAKAWLFKGKIKLELEETENALICFLEAKNFIKKVRSDSLLFEINDELGEIFIETGLYREALDIYYKNYSLQQKINNIRNLTISLRNIGYTYLFLEQSDSASLFFEQGLKMAQSSEDSIYLSDLIYMDLGVYYHDKEEYYIGLNFIKKVRSNKFSVDLIKGILYYNTEQYDSAKQQLIHALRCEFIFTKASANFYLSKIEEKKFDYKSANVYLQTYNNIKDSLNHITKTSNINYFNHNFNYIKENIRIRYNSIFITSVFTFILIIIVVISIFFLIESKKKRKLYHQNNEIMNLKQQLTDTQSKILTINENKNKLSIDKNLTLLKSKIDELQCKMFKMKDIYSVIINLSNQKKNPNLHRKMLSRKEREILMNELYECFPELINLIITSYPKAKEDDLKLCCLSKLGLSLNTICLCFGFSESDPIRQRKYYLKKKMINEYNCSDTFHYIFPKKPD